MSSRDTLREPRGWRCHLAHFTVDSPEPLLLSTYTFCLDDLIQSRDFKCHLYAHEPPICISRAQHLVLSSAASLHVGAI